MERARAARGKRRLCNGAIDTAQTSRAMCPQRQAIEGCDHAEVTRDHRRTDGRGHLQMPPFHRRESLLLIDRGFEDSHYSFEDSQQSSEKSCTVSSEERSSPNSPLLTRESLFLIDRGFENGCRSFEDSQQSSEKSCASSEERSSSNSPLLPGPTIKYKDHSSNSTIERDSGVSSSIERDCATSPRIEKGSSASASGADEMTFLPKNPLKWTVSGVRSWLDMMAGMHSISNLDKTKFSMNGLGVALIPKKGFVKRLGQQHGSLLYKDYHRRLKLALQMMM